MPSLVGSEMCIRDRPSVVARKESPLSRSLCGSAFFTPSSQTLLLPPLTLLLPAARAKSPPPNTSEEASNDNPQFFFVHPIYLVLSSPDFSSPLFCKTDSGSRNSTSPPPHRCAPSFLSREQFNIFLPRRILHTYVFCYRRYLLPVAIFCARKRPLKRDSNSHHRPSCLLYTSDAADE